MFRKVAIILILTVACLSACALPGTQESTGLNLESAPNANAVSGQADAKALPKATIVVEATPVPTEPSSNVMPQSEMAGSAETLSELAVADLATRLGVSESAITVVSAAAHTFNDSSLGVRQPGKMYMQVLTPGYIIILKADGQSYTYHGARTYVVYAGAPDETPSTKLPVPSSLPAQEGDLVTLYLSDPERAAGDCSLVFAVRRASEDAAVSAGGISAGELALRALLAGPTDDEKAMGFTSPFTTATADALISLSVDGDTAYVNLRNIPAIVTLDDACARMQLEQQLERTLKNAMPVARVLVALDGDPSAWCAWLNLPCDESQGNCDPAPFQPTRIPLRQAVPTIPPSPAPVLDLEAALPDEAEIVRQASHDMDRDGADEVVVLVGQPSESETMAYDWLKLMVVLPGPEPKVLWQMRTMGTRAMGLELRDINSDGQLEVLSLQSMGASGQTLYALTWRNGSYELLRPQGGYFAGWDSFGAKGVGFEDVTGDGVDEIFAAYGPAATKRDVYQWDGAGYVYLSTQDFAGQ